MKRQRKRLCVCLLAGFLAMAALPCAGQSKGTGSSSGSGSSGGSGGSGKPSGTATPSGGGSSGGGGGARAAGPAAASGGSSGGGGSVPFAIETEMLAYKALQSDSEAIACDIAGFLSSSAGERLTPNGPSFVGKKGDASVQAMRTACANTPSGTPTGVIILSSSGNTLANFQAWRVDMATMRSLQAQANAYCPAQAQSQ